MLGDMQSAGSVRGLILAVLAALVTVLHVDAVVLTFDTHALSGETAPGTGDVFRQFGYPVIDDAGRVAFRAITSDGTRGLWTDSSGSLSLVALDGTAAPDTSGVFNFLDTVNMNDSGEIAFGNAMLAGTGGVTISDNGGVWTDSSGSLSLLVREGDVAPGTAGAVYSGISDTPAFNDAGEIMLVSSLTSGIGDTTADNNSGLWAGSAGALSLLVREGDNAPGAAVGEVFNGVWGGGSLNGAGQVIFHTGLTGPGVTGANDTGIWSDTSGSLSLVAREGDTAPGTAGGVFSGLSGGPTLNDAGQTAFYGDLVAGVGDATDANNAGLWSDRSGSLDVVWRKGDSAPGVAAGQVFRGFDHITINGEGQIAFVGSLTGSGVTNDNNEGIWFEQSDTLSLIAREGDAAPGTGGVFRSFSLYSSYPMLSGSGMLTFIGGVSGDGITPGNDRGIWVSTPDGELRLIVREGDLFDVDDDPLVEDLRTISRVYLLLGNSGGEDGALTPINDSGQIAFGLKFTNDSSTGVFVATIRLPGDLSGDWFVDSDDIDILSANWGQAVTADDWSSGDPTGDGIVGIEDLRAVLSNWDGGVPPAGLEIPEPISSAVLWISGLVLTCRRRSGGSSKQAVTPPTDPDTRPSIEPLEPRVLLSGSISAQFVEVDNTSALAGYNTFDLQVISTNDWTAGALLLTLTQGTIYQDANGDNTTPNPAFFGAFPSLEFDTYVGGDVDSPTIIGAAGDLGGDAFQFDASELDVTWFNVDSGDTGTFDLARFTLSDDAVGTWSMLLVDDTDASLSWSGEITSGRFASVDGDFTGDGKADIAWHNTRNGRNAVWEMDGVALRGEIAVKRLRNSDWKLVGTGDFTGDGHNDLLWRNTRDGRNTVWEMNGTTYRSGNAIQGLGNPDWQIAGVGDFTGDGKQDILWRHVRVGRNTVWEMDGLTLQGATAIRAVNNADWQIGGVADFTGDGKDDILWRHGGNGRNCVWEMDGTSYQNNIALQTISDTDWRVGGVADFTGDGKADIFWRHTGRGINTLWRMDGTTRLGSGLLNNQSDLDWQPASAMLGLWEN